MDGYTTASWTYYGKDGHCGRWACIIDIEKQYYCRDVFFKQIDLVYDTITDL